MISNALNEGSREVKWILHADIYRIQNWTKNHFGFILDIGANIGVFSTMARFLHPKSKIVAIEPCTETFRYLQSNSNMLDIVCENVALGKTNGLASMEDRQRLRDIDRRLLTAYFSDNPNGKTKTESLEEMFQKHYTNGHYFLKIDCEGAEKTLVGNTESEKVIKESSQTALEIHFQSEDTPVKSWLTYEEYSNWIFKSFSSSHTIEEHTTNLKHGYSHYIMRKKI